MVNDAEINMDSVCSTKELQTPEDLKTGSWELSMLSLTSFCIGHGGLALDDPEVFGETQFSSTSTRWHVSKAHKSILGINIMHDPTLAHLTAKKDQQYL